jgi:ATP-dependent DNA helicase RecG
MICEFIGRFGEARRADIDRLLLDKLPDVLDERQKANKVRNLLQALKNQGDIVVEGKVWRMSKQ